MPFGQSRVEAAPVLPESYRALVDARDFLPGHEEHAAVQPALELGDEVRSVFAAALVTPGRGPAVRAHEECGHDGRGEELAGRTGDLQPYVDDAADTGTVGVHGVGTEEVSQDHGGLPECAR